MFPLDLQRRDTLGEVTRSEGNRSTSRSLENVWCPLVPRALPASQLCPPTKRRTRSLTHRRRAVRAWERFQPSGSLYGASSHHRFGKQREICVAPV